MKKSNTYHNTTNQDKEFVNDAIRSCKNQEEKVIVILSIKRKASASEIWSFFSKVYLDNTPLTSIRRALSNLTHEGKLTKEDKTKIGLYGRPECYYTLNESK